MCEIVEKYAEEYVKVIAKNMLADGMSDEKISELTNLSLDEVKALHSN